MEEARTAAAEGNPIRRSLIEVLAEADGALSLDDLARLFELPLPQIHYHVKVLEAADKVLLAATEADKGRIRYFYSAAPGG